MGDAQLEATILRSCLALPKVSFVLHACPPSHLAHSLTEFDEAIHRTLKSSHAPAAFPLALYTALAMPPATLLTSLQQSLLLPPQPTGWIGCL